MKLPHGCALWSPFRHIQALLPARTLCCATALLMASCGGSRSRYAWGGYEATVLSTTSDFGNESSDDVETLIQRAETDIERANVSEKLIPPGLHAQLGLLYTLRGDQSLAVAAFEAEMALYPESQAFLKGVLERMGAGS